MLISIFYLINCQIPEPSGEQNTSKELQVYMPEKRHFWQTILEKILNLFGRKQEAC